MYPAQASVFGLRPIYLTLREGDGQWHLDRDELVLNTPHNPTGKVFTRDELRFVASVAVEHDLLVVTDEIYEQITYDGQRHLPLAAEHRMRERTISVNSISKTGNATDWRVGWVIAPVPHTAKILAVHDTLAIQAPTPLQKAAVELLTMPASFSDGLRSRYTRKREILVTALRDAGFRCGVPQGAYYLFADYHGVPALRGRSPMETAMFLIEDIGVTGVPGDNFDASPNAGRTQLRFAFCRSPDALDEAARRLRKLA